MKEIDRINLIRELEELCGIPHSLLVRLNDEEMNKLYKERVIDRTVPSKK
ncbi:hypothetical protein [Alteribacillus sp. YIM 98480]|nr:hypothetical protein [Alteribacillus sp. YIM 98480]